MIEVELWDYHTHTLYGFKKVFKIHLQFSFSNNMFLKIWFEFGKSSFWTKQAFIKRNFYQNVFTS